MAWTVGNEPVADSSALARHLTLKAGQRLIVRRCPEHLHDAFKALGAAFDRGTIAEITLSFVRSVDEMENACKEAIALTAPGGALWMAYPKKSPTLSGNLTRDEGWEPFAAAGWRPVAEIALDETWSALRFRPGERERD